MNENAAEGQQRDFGFRRFLEKEGQDYKVSQRTTNGLTLVELLIPSIDKGISLMESGKSGGGDRYVILSNGKLVAAKSEWPPKIERGNIPPESVDAVVIGDKIRTYKLDDANGFLAGIWEGYDNGEFLVAQNDEITFNYLLSSAPYIPDIGIQYLPPGRKRSSPEIILKDVPPFVLVEHGWIDLQTTEPTMFTYRGKKYSLERSSEKATVVIESPDDIVEMTFPQRLAEEEIIGLKALLLTDTDWLDVLEASPTLHYSRTLKHNT